MGLFSRKKAEQAPIGNNNNDHLAVESESEPVPSGAPSVGDFKEKVDDVPSESHSADVPVEKAIDANHNATAAPRDATLEDENALEKKIEAMEAEEDAQAVDDYPHALQLTLITIALCLSVFCVALDNTIITTAIPRITDHFHSIDDVGWYGSAYLLTTCAFQLFFGKLYTFFSTKYVYLVAIFIFEVGSAVCGAAPSSAALIVGRAVAGLGTAGIFSGALLIVSNTVPLEKRPIYTGLIGGMYGIASVAGPLLGGAFTDKVTWRWCFYINLPIGAITVLFIGLFYKPTKSARSLAQGWKAKLEQFDIWGTLVFLPAVVCLLLALQWGGTKYPWHDGRIIALFVVFAVLIIIFTAVQFWKKDNATVPPRVLKQRTVAASSWYVVALGASFFIMIYYIPIYFQAIKGVSAVQSGIRNLPMILSLVIFSIGSGIAVTVLGYYTPWVIASSVIMAVGAGLLSTLRVDSGPGKWIGYQIVFGLGVGMGMQQTLIAVQTVLPKADIPIGTAIIIFAQTLGGAIFISVGQNVFSNRLLHNLLQVVPNLNPEIVISTGATSLQGVIPPEYLSGVLVAYNDAIVSTFYVAVAMGAASIFGSVFLEWKSVKGKEIGMGGAA